MFADIVGKSELCKNKILQNMSAYDIQSDVGMFLVNFERLGEQLEVPREQWAAQLIKLVFNDVAAVIARMPTNEAADYSPFKI